MDAKRAMRNLAGIRKKYDRVGILLDPVTKATVTNTPAMAVGKRDALAKKLGRLGDRLKEMTGQVEETERLVRGD